MKRKRRGLHQEKWMEVENVKRVEETQTQQGNKNPGKKRLKIEVGMIQEKEKTKMRMLKRMQVRRKKKRNLKNGRENQIVKHKTVIIMFVLFVD